MFIFAGILIGAIMLCIEKNINTNYRNEKN